MNTVKTVLIIGFVWPEPKSSAAGSRIMQLIEFFLAKGWKVSFASAASTSDYSFDLTSIGVEKEVIQLNNSSFDSFVSRLQPDIVLFDRFMTEEQFGWRVVEHCPSSIRILDTEDLHCLRFARQNAFKEKRTFSNIDLVSDIAKREIASIYRCDLSLIISSFEMTLLQDFFKVDAELLYYLPFMLDSIAESVTTTWPPFESRNNFISIGNFLHEPNVNAVQYLKEDIWPLIRKELPEAELHIYGAYPPQKITQLHNPKEGFIVKGRVEDANVVVKNAKVCLAPLRFGAGIKGKLVEAMICGTPSVTTDIGAEGMHADYPWSGNVANDATTIAAAAIRLYTDKVCWEQAQENGIKIMNGVYAKNKLGDSFINRLDELHSTINDHRVKNFTGAMLMHHTISSTKYMSRWIELKNK